MGRILKTNIYIQVIRKSDTFKNTKEKINFLRDKLTEETEKKRRDENNKNLAKEKEEREKAAKERKRREQEEISRKVKERREIDELLDKYKEILNELKKHNKKIHPKKNLDKIKI